MLEAFWYMDKAMEQWMLAMALQRLETRSLLETAARNLSRVQSSLRIL